MVKRVLLYVAVILLIGSVVLNSLDLIGVFNEPKNYPFGSDFFSPYSIYSSKLLYVLYSIGSIITSLLTLFFGYKKKWALFFLLLFVNILFVIYPILTNTESLFFLGE